MAAVVGSVLLGSADARRLRDWYLAAFGARLDTNGFLDFGRIALLIDDRDDVAAENPEPGRVILNFHVDDALAAAEHLDSLGVIWLVEVEQRPDGLFGTLLDPDGNCVQIIQLRDDYSSSP